jgi:hypothetical protein
LASAATVHESVPIGILVPVTLAGPAGAPLEVALIEPAAGEITTGALYSDEPAKAQLARLGLAVIWSVHEVIACLADATCIIAVKGGERALRGLVGSE